jgi:hypothetical protein
LIRRYALSFVSSWVIAPWLDRREQGVIARRVG